MVLAIIPLGAVILIKLQVSSSILTIFAVSGVEGSILYSPNVIVVCEQFSILYPIPVLSLITSVPILVKILL